MNLNPAPMFWLACATILSYSANAQDAITFGYTGDVEIYVVPNCVSQLEIELKGAAGGGPNGGNGSTVTGIIDVVEGEILEIRVGGAGECPAAGYNGGGVGGTASGGNAGCGGGGASDIRIGGSALRIAWSLLQAAEAWVEEIRMLTRVREGAMPAARGIAPLVKAESVPHKMQADQADLLGLDQATTAMRVNSVLVAMVPLTPVTTSVPAEAEAEAITEEAEVEVIASLRERSAAVAAVAGQV